jgi:Concanavalin A-like lectin/glucanases superfamily/Immunoglobulin domain
MAVKRIKVEIQQKTRSYMKTNSNYIQICIVGVALLVLPSLTQAQSFLTNGLVAYYTFNGNAHDVSGNGNNGTAVNGVSYVASPLGFAASFNGNSQYISLPNSITINEDFTVTFWINTGDYNPNGYPYGDFLISRDVYGPAADWNICLGGGRQIQFVTGDSPLVLNNNLSSNIWLQVACVADSANQIKTISVNGQVVASTTWQPFVFVNNSMPIFLGASTADTGGHAFFTGGMADLRIYNRALSTNEVAQLFAFETASNSTPLPSGLVSWWPGEGNANDVISGNNGSLIGNTSYTNGEVGQAFMMYGNGDMVTVGNPTNLQLQNFTIEGWIKRASPSIVSYGSWGNGDIFGYGYGGYGLYLDSNGNPALSRIGIDETKPNATITDTNFHHLAVTKSGSVVVFYVDGIAYSAPDYDPGFVFSTVAAIGGRGDNLDNGFFGVIDEISFYNRALSLTEIQGIYNAGSAGKGTQAPNIITQPQPLTVNAGDNVSFTVTASGSSPLNYQWSLNGTNISGATASSLTISNVAQTDLGVYAVMVSNTFGSTNSSNAMLSIYPFIESPFTGTITYWGRDTTLGVVGWGTGPLHYQWFKDGVALLNATNQTLFLPGIQFTSAGLYSVVLSSPLGSVTNKPAQVVVNPAGVLIGMYPGVTVSGVVGYTYTIQASSDLTNTNGWTTVATLTLIQPVQLWVDISVNALSPTNPHKYYRVVPGG